MYVISSTKYPPHQRKNNLLLNLMSYIRSLYKDNKETSDDYSTRLEEFQRLKHIVPEGKIILDPFYYDGYSGKYIKEVFKPKKVIHTKHDFFNGKHKLPEFDIIITNPPFSKKYQVLKWLIKTQKPFLCLFPMQIISTKKFIDMTEDEELTIHLRSGRMRFERNGELLLVSAHYPCVWISKDMYVVKPSQRKIRHNIEYV